MADSLVDAVTRHQVWLQRLATHEANKFEPFLREVDKIIRDILSRGDMETVKQLNEVLTEVRERVTPVYGDWTDMLIEDLQEISESESDFNQRMIQNLTQGVEVVAAGAAAWLLARTQPVQTNQDGESQQLIPFIKSFTPRETRRIIGVIRNGFAQGETNSQIVQKIRGTRKNRFKDGILNISTRNAEAITRTTVNHIANTARMATYEKNRDILEGWEFLATLDSRTTNICRFNDGGQHDIGEGPLPPLHVNCRSTTAPVVKSEFRTFDEEDETRASKGAEGGQQTSKSPYYNWLQTQPKWFQQEVLGNARTELFRKGGLTNEEFRRATSDNFGQPLTLEEIERNNPRAWERAGLPEM